MSTTTHKVTTEDGVFKLWTEGKGINALTKLTGLRKSAVTAKLRKAFSHMLQKGAPWPVADNGYYLCDYPHPMPEEGYAFNWVHPQAIVIKLKNGSKLRCPVCGRTFTQARTLKEVLL